VNALLESATKKKEVEKGLISLAKRVEELDQAIKNASLLFIETSTVSSQSFVSFCCSLLNRRGIVEHQRSK